jgi:hypothetical protein
LCTICFVSESHVYSYTNSYGQRQSYSDVDSDSYYHTKYKSKRNAYCDTNGNNEPELNAAGDFYAEISPESALASDSAVAVDTRAAASLTTPHAVAASYSPSPPDTATDTIITATHSAAASIGCISISNVALSWRANI